MNAGLIVGAFFVGIFAILILIMLHELGHFLIAKLAGAYVYEFSIGFGPRIFTYKGKETWFSIRVIPLGGFVSIASDRVDPPEGREEESESIPDDRKMDYLARWKKALFILAGPIMNFAIAIIMISIIFMATLQKTNDMSFNGNKYNHSDIAYKLISEKEKDNMSFLKDDQNISITGWEVILLKNDDNINDYNDKNSNELYAYAEQNKGDIKFIFSNLISDSNFNQELEESMKENYGNDFRILNDINSKKAPDYIKIVYNFLDNFDNKLMKSEDGFSSYIRFSYRQMNPNLYTGEYESNSINKITNFSSKDGENVFNLDGKNSKVGVTPPTRIFKNTTQAYGYSWKEMGEQSLALLKAFGMLFTGHINQLAGPVGVANQTAQMITKPDTLFLYIAGLSANLFILNLIPIPPLDGYKFVENAIEAALKREIKQKTKIWLYTAGAILFIVIFVVITIKDFVIG